MNFLQDPSGDDPSVITRIPGLAAEGPTAFGTFLNAMSAFLLDPVRVRRGLALLNDRMWMLADREARPGLTRERLLSALAQRRPDRDDDMRVAADSLLSRVLTEVENEHGFEVEAPRRRAVTLSDLVLNDPFREDLITKGRTWKDPSVNPTHGEFTHRLQWCAAMLAEPDMVGALGWLTCFVRIGTYTDRDPVDGQRFGLWDALVDRNSYTPGAAGPTPYNSRNELDLRSPENLQAWLLALDKRMEGSDIRFLATFIQARDEKRREEERTGVPYMPPDRIVPGGVPLLPPGRLRLSTWDQWSRVLFQNRTSIQLSTVEKAVLARAWFRLTTLQDGSPLYPIMVVDGVDQPPRTGPDLVDAYRSLGLNDDGL